MSDNTKNNKKSVNENADNMAQNEEMDEALANVLNADDSRSGGELNEGNDEEIEKLQSEIQEQKDKYLRLMAEFDNFKRRTAKEKSTIGQLKKVNYFSCILFCCKLAIAVLTNLPKG